MKLNSKTEKIMMDNTDIFDKYINDELSEQERNEFEVRIKNDKEFSDDFKVYAAIVIGICQEAEQDNKDFEMAMKNLTKEQLQEIIGKRHDEKEKVTPLHIEEATPTKQVNKSWIWKATSIAAVIALIVVWVPQTLFTPSNSLNYAVDDAIYACADINVVSKGDDDDASIDITKLSDKELRTKLPEITALYTSCTDKYELYDNGKVLVMAYIRLHDRENAKEILTELIEKLETAGFNIEEVEKLKSILKLIQ